MTNEKLLEVFSFYRHHLAVLDITPSRWPAEHRCPEYNRPMLEHVLWMLDEATKFVETGRSDKAFRWLGFIQGVLWTCQIFTIEELAKHNRPSGETE